MIITNYSLLDSFGDPILLLDDYGYIVYSTPSILPVTGYNPDELLGKDLSILYPNNNDAIKLEYELGNARKKGKYISTGFRKRKDGSAFWAEMTFVPVSLPDLKGFNCMVRDHTEKKQEEIKKSETEQRYRLMVQGVKEYAIFMLDVNGYIMTWNEGAKLINGYLESEIIGKHFSIFYTHEDLKNNKPRKEIEIAIVTGKYEEESWRVKKDGSLFWANVVITSLYNENNELIGLSKITRDLTDRKNNEESLRQSEIRYRSLVEQVKDYGIFLMDDKGRIISWNEGAKRIKGYTAEEIIGKYFTIFYPEEELLNEKPAYELKVARSEGQYEEEGWRIRKGGTRFWANIVITAVYNNNGNLIGFSKVTRDLTEKKEAEKALRDSFDKYRELAEQLKISNAELAEANKELEQFTYIVSHDLQEPIRSIKSFLKLIEIKIQAEEYQQLQLYIKKAAHTADRMKELIQNLLHYSQLSKVDVIINQINIEQLFSEAFENLKTLIRESNAQIRMESELKWVKGDKVQLLQLIQNLLSNAMKFTDKQSPEIRIRVMEENGYPKFSISDNGIGIATDDLRKVFEIFRRLHTEKEIPGTGIGLAICKKIVERHRGNIWLESAPRKGTTFYFTLGQY